jgi:polyisoprenoid-binding protein YceI
MTQQVISGAVIAALSMVAPPAFAATYQIDPVHSAIIFYTKHFNAGHTWGRLGGVKGEIRFDAADASKSSVTVRALAKTVFTGDKKRDKHLRSPDFLSAKQFTHVSFRSQSVAKTSDDRFSVTGELTLRGVTKPVTVEMAKIGEGKDPWGGERIGFEGRFTIKLSDFDIKGMPGAVGEDVHLIVAVEGVKK